jgi:CelD/BcsL family acetyltransferase involved in cellulose biosynthesis
MLTAVEFEAIDVPGNATPDPSLRSYEVELVERWQALESQAELAAWDDLAAQAIEPNHFFSSGAVLAAMRHLRPAGEPAFLVVRAKNLRAPNRPAIWCGFFPLVRFRSYRGVWIPNLRLLKHDYCFLRVPLVRADCVTEVLRVVFEWLEASGYALVELGDQTGEGAYADALRTLLRQPGRNAWLASSQQRALLRRAATTETEPRLDISSRRLKELRRQERRLREQGELAIESLSPHAKLAEVELAIAEFLQLERAGWKGAQGTAMACRPADRDFFAGLVRAAWRAGQLRMITMRLDGRPIAMKCNFVALPGSFAFKIAYAEELAHYSPGVLLELENMRRLHSDARVQWMDSCAAPGHPMLEHLWKDHRRIESWILPLGNWGRFVAITLSVLQRARRKLQAKTRSR